MKGPGGVIVDLGGGISGFLRGPSLPPPGRPLLVQASGWAEPGKAAPVTSRHTSITSRTEKPVPLPRL